MLKCHYINKQTNKYFNKQTNKNKKPELLCQCIGLEQGRNTALNINNNNTKNQKFYFRVALYVHNEGWEEG